MENASEFFDTYLEKLREYCNQYDNIAILNQVKAFVGEENVSLSDVYADFELVSREEYDRGNGTIGHSSFFSSQKDYTHLLEPLYINHEQQVEINNENSETGAENYIINGMVVLSEPGGGKTTYLKHLIHNLISCYKNNVLNDQLFATNGLDKNVEYIPFFTRTRDLTDVLNDNEINIENLFDAIIENSVITILNVSDKIEDRDIVATIASLINEKINRRYLFVIDGFEELNDEKAGKLLECLKYAYDNGKLDRTEDRLVISSRYKEYGYQKLVSFCKEYSITERFIKFDNKNGGIDDCVSKWFDILRKTGQDMHEYFNQVRASNSDISKLITTPLELTGLIMLCHGQSALPTDITVLYRSIIEIWLTYGIRDANIPFFSLSDIFLELATIAYCMAESEDKFRISRRVIKEIIEKSRKELRRYYRSNSYVGADEFDELIDFWLKRNIFVKKTKDDIYEFAHREYQSYLISYAIINNFIPKNMRPEDDRKRIKYVEKHMEQAEDFWDRVIVFSAFMSTDFHDDIIDYVLTKIQNRSEGTGESFLQMKEKMIDEYLWSIILQLMNAEGFYFTDDECKLLFDELLKNDRIYLLQNSIKGSEIKKLLTNGRKQTNTLFLKKSVEVLQKCIEEIEELRKQDSAENLLVERKKDKDNIINRIGNIVFHIAWNCEADRDAIKKAFGLYLDNWITMDIVYEIKESLAFGRYSVDRVNIIREIGFDAITRKETPLTDCYMIISMILGFSKAFETDCSLYKVACNYFDMADCCVDENEKLEATIIAINIVYMTTWFLQETNAEKCDCGLKDGEGKWNERLLEEYLECVGKIIEYMRNVKLDSVYSRDLFAAYRDLCLLKLRKPELGEKVLPILFDKEVFNNCLSICDSEDVLKTSDDTELAYAFEIVSLYPLTSEYFELCESKPVLRKRIADIIECKENTRMTYGKAVRILKLLVFAGAFNDDKGGSPQKLETEIGYIRNMLAARVGGPNQNILESIETFWQDNLGGYRLDVPDRHDYDALMEYMDRKIDEL